MLPAGCSRFSLGFVGARLIVQDCFVKPVQVEIEVSNLDLSLSKVPRSLEQAVNGCICSGGIAGLQVVRRELKYVSGFPRIACNSILPDSARVVSPAAIGIVSREDIVHNVIARLGPQNIESQAFAFCRLTVIKKSPYQRLQYLGLPRSDLVGMPQELYGIFELTVRNGKVAFDTGAVE